jgi:hypothetical protein
MALISALKEISMDVNFIHGEADCTFTIFTDEHGKKYLQVDTYGSATRQHVGKKSQSLQFGPEALAQLKNILQTRF